ncbi:MAG: YceD family protein [Solirubrobacteraceae bacterium]
MSLRTDTFDLAALLLSAGEARRLDLQLAIDALELGGERYCVVSDPVPVRLDVARTIGAGYALRLRFGAPLSGPCMRCLDPADRVFTVDAREVSQPGEIEAPDSPYVEGETLNLRAWARDALALALPAQFLCDPHCAGLCAACGVNLNDAGTEHGHEPEPDRRWAKLSEVRFD